MNALHRRLIVLALIGLIVLDPVLVDAEKPPNKKTALHLAAAKGWLDITNMLLAAVMRSIWLENVLISALAG